MAARRKPRASDTPAKKGRAAKSSLGRLRALDGWVVTVRPHEDGVEVRATGQGASWAAVHEDEETAAAAVLARVS